MSRNKILKMQKPNIYIYIYIYIFITWQRTFSSPNRLEKKKNNNDNFHRLKLNRQGYKFPCVKIIWRQK
jgi:hypothetical protein